MNYGKAISTIRKKNKYSQKDFSKIVGIDQSYLSQIENNKKRPSTKLLDNISSKLGIPVPILFFLTLSEDDISPEKKELFEIIYPRISDMIFSLINPNDDLLRA